MKISASRSVCFTFVALIASVVASGCLPTYGENAGGKVKISQSSLYNYMSKAEIARPEIVREAYVNISSGKRFRKHIIDQNNRWCLATVWIDKSNQSVLNITTSRNETCPVCGGTGKRKWSNEQMANLPFDTRCLKCDGKGVLDSKTVERKYVLSDLDFDNPQSAKATLNRSTVYDAPPETQRYIDMLAHDDAKQRLQACIWLDQHYVKKGEDFQKIMPMLKKARWHEKSAEKDIMLWQFHAGKGMTGEHNRAYYRVYVSMSKGRIIQKGFYPEQ
ncbi:MAG: hypothetical protein JXR97_12080 [Planctomycetes bacterium]|nr:hypothetical protein [Planctomycetota bacterium]